MDFSTDSQVFYGRDQNRWALGLFKKAAEDPDASGHSKTLAPLRACLSIREFLECGCPLPLFLRPFRPIVTSNHTRFSTAPLQ
jgi:hypothetical protein